MRDIHGEGNGKRGGNLHGTVPNTRLRNARSRRGWRQNDVAAAVEHLEAQLAGGRPAALGLDGGMVGRWERGEHEASLFYQARLCLVFDAKNPEELGFTPLPGLVDEIRSLQERRERAAAGSVPPPAAISVRADEVDAVPSALIVVVASDGGLAASAGGGAVLRLTSEQLAALEALLQGDDALRSQDRRFDPSRRLALQRLVSAATLAVLTPAALADASIWDPAPRPGGAWESFDEASQEHLHRLLSSAWALSEGRDLEIAERVVSGILPRLVHYAAASRDGARLAVHALRLLSILRAHSLNFEAKIELCRQAVGYARLAGDPTALTAALTELAVAFKYAGDPNRSLSAYQEAVSVCNSASPLVRSRAYAASAAAFARCGRPREAEMYINLAYEAFPTSPGTDSEAVFADSGIHMLAYYQGVMHLDLGEPGQADDAFESYKLHPAGSGTPVRNRLEILNHQARAAIQMRDLDRYVSLLDTGLQGAVAIGSRKRLDEAVTTLRNEAPSAWHGDARIKQIGEQFNIPVPPN